MPAIGVYRGTVVSCTDPMGSSRVQVMVPELGMSSAWAAAVPAATSRGSYQVGATVIVAF